MAQTNFLKALREQLGLTQQQLADWLMITRTQLNMCEREQRNIPAAAMLRFLNIFQLMQKQSKAKQTAVPAQLKQHLPAALKKLEKQAKRYDAKALVTELALEKMQQACTQHTALLNIVEAMQPDADTPYDKNYLSILKHAAEDSLEKNGLHKQAELQIELNMHRHLAGSARAQLLALQQVK